MSTDCVPVKIVYTPSVLMLLLGNSAHLFQIPELAVDASDTVYGFLKSRAEEALCVVLDVK